MEHRLKQHNGEITGGAKFTESNRPWEVILCVYGFSSQRQALQFELQWQRPFENHACVLKMEQHRTKIGHVSTLRAKILVCYLLLSLPPWNILSLTIHWVNKEIYNKYNHSLHDIENTAKITFGSLRDMNVLFPEADKENSVVSTTIVGLNCAVCLHTIHNNDKTVCCLNENCPMTSHIKCLSNHLLRESSNLLLPSKGSCPLCKVEFMWRDIVNTKKKPTVYNKSEVKSMANKEEILIEDDEDVAQVAKNTSEEDDNAFLFKEYLKSPSKPTIIDLG